MGNQNQGKTSLECHEASPEITGYACIFKQRGIQDTIQEDPVSQGAEANVE
jgi:hypothetical protein